MFPVQARERGRLPPKSRHAADTASVKSRCNSNVKQNQAIHKAFVFMTL